MEKTQTNRPLSHKEIKELKPSVGLAYTHEHPNRAQRRLIKQTLPSNNRKTTKGRKRQVADIMAPEMKFGEKVLVPTGFIRRILHRVAEAKKDRAVSKMQDRIYAAREPKDIDLG